MADSKQPVKVIGIVGGIGSGKSQVTRLLAEAGAPVISGDALGHEALLQPDIREQVVRRWGDGLLEKGEIQRPKLGGIVFADPSALRELERLVHPWIKRRIAEEIEAARRTAAVPLIVLDAAILLEAGWDGPCDELVFVDVPRTLRLERIVRQRGWTEREVDAREKAQWPLKAKAARATVVVDNAGTLDDLRRQVGALLARWGVPRPVAVPD